MSTLYNHIVLASINEAFTYQGKIVNSDGTNVKNADASCISEGGADTCDLRISLYTASSGGTLVWQETKTDIEIYDNDGIFNLTLDCGGTFSTCNQNGGPEFTSGQLFIQIEFDPSGNGDFSEGETFNPRRELTSSPYAFQAKNADTLGGVSSSSFLRTDADSTLGSGNTLTADGTLDIAGDIVISDTGLVFDGANTEFTITGDFSINKDGLFIQNGTGYMGIGTSNPNTNLDVAGSLRTTDNLDVEGYGAYGNGTALNANTGLVIDYDTTFTGIGQQLLVKGAVEGAAGANVYGAAIQPDSITIPSGTTTLAASLYLSEPNIIETGTLTNAATLYIAGSASEGDNNYALWIDSGNVQIDDYLAVLTGEYIGGATAGTAGIILNSNGSATFNEQGNDSNFRIEGNGAGLEYLFFVDAGAGTVGVKTNAPTAHLDLPASNADHASLRLRTGVEPTVPNEGDVFADGTTIYYRDSANNWLDLGAAADLQSSYVAGNTITTDSGEGALTFELATANFDIVVGSGTDTGDFRIWDGSADNWLLLDENTSTISLGNSSASTGLSLTSGTTWSLTTAGALAGITTISSSGDWSWSATTPTITITSSETFTLTDGTDNFAINTSGSTLSYSDGSNSVTFDLDTGPLYAGTARPSKKIALSPEYSGAVLTPFYGAGTDTSISGTMTSDAETSPASNIRSYYSWERNASGQHYYTVAIRFTLPQDFGSWETSNAVVINYITEHGTNTNCDVDARIYLEGNGTVDASSLDNSNVSWSTISFAASDLDLWNEAGEIGVIYLRLGSQSGYYARVGDIVLSYKAKF